MLLATFADVARREYRREDIDADMTGKVQAHRSAASTRSPTRKLAHRETLQYQLPLHLRPPILDSIFHDAHIRGVYTASVICCTVLVDMVRVILKVAHCFSGSWRDSNGY